MQLSNKTYDVLKIVAWLITPCITFMTAIMVIWGVPYSEQITATLAAFDTFLGSLLAISNKNYNESLNSEDNLTAIVDSLTEGADLEVDNDNNN